MHTRAVPAITVECGPLTLRSERQGDEHVVALYGELDISGVEALDEELRRVEQSSVPQIIIDLSGLEFLDSTVLRCLLKFHARAAGRDVNVAFLRGSETVQRVFEITDTVDRLTFLD